jgi:tRNA pseudouridine38-40 synthase
MRTLKLVMAYEGTAYHGWQRQPNGVTIQEVFEDTLAKIIGPHRCVAAGRTDAGVHALGQVVSVRTGKTIATQDLFRALNATLPRDIAIQSIDEVPNEFDPRKDAISKLYRYRVYHAVTRPVLQRNLVWHVFNVDWDAVERAARELVGEHDFASFRDSQCRSKHARRTLTRVEVVRNPPAENECWLEFEGNGFVKHMVRNMVGTLIEIGRGFQKPEWIKEVLAAKDRKAAGTMAAASGLTLVRVVYP